MLQLRLPGYVGPLDLLLELIERNELDISELSLVQVADQYMQQLQRIEARASGPESGAADSLPEALTEFIVIGSKLMLLKSRALLRFTDAFWRLKINNRVTDSSKEGALIRCGHKSRAPIIWPAQRAATVVIHDNKCRQA